MAGLWVNECGNALDVELSAGLGEVEGRGRRCNDGLRLGAAMNRRPIRHPTVEGCSTLDQSSDARLARLLALASYQMERTLTTALPRL